MNYVAIMAEYEKFGELVREKVRTYIKVLDQDEVRKHLRYFLWGVGEKPEPFQWTQEQDFYSETFWHYWEISISLENLDYIPVFIKKPFRESKAYQEAGITKASYLRYHIEHYLQENYILLERVDRFLGWLSHQLRNEGRMRDSKIVLQLRDAFDGGMNNLRLVRKRHVHIKRFDEDELSRLDFFEAFSTDSEDEKVERVSGNIATELYMGSKEEWTKRIKENNKNLRKMIDALFGALIPIVFPSEVQGAK